MSTTSFVGPSAVEVFRAIVIANALDLYARTGMKANRMYTPANMRRTAEHITGKKFKARDYAGMAAALREYAGKTAETKCVKVEGALVDAADPRVQQA
jgi:hypothetical protein